LNEQLKKRLVGAVVLISLAVIVLPLFLDGDKRGGIAPLGSSLPPRPESAITPLEIPLELPPAEARGRRAYPVVEAPVADEPEASGEARTDADSAPPATVEEAAPPPATNRWAVQVGSFSQSSNALGLRDRLRDAGFAAYVEQVGIAGKNTYRVRVGPVLVREAAETLRVELQEKIGIESLVVGHP